MPAKVEKKTGRVYVTRTVSLPPDFIAEIEQKAAEESRSFSAQVVHLCKQALKRGRG